MSSPERRSWRSQSALALGLAFAAGGALVGVVAVLAGPIPAALFCALGALAAAGIGAWLVEPVDERLNLLTQRVVRETGQTEQPVGVDRLAILEHALNSLLIALARARRHLRRHQALEDAIFASSLGGLVVTGNKGLIRAINPAVRELLPLVPEPLGKRPIEAIPFTPLARALEDAVEHGEVVEREAVSGRFDLVLRAVPLGESGGAIAVIVDITSAKRAERARSDFVANVSHELRTPITSILGYAETLLGDPDSLDPDVKDMLEVVLRNAQRLSNLFNDLLELSRIEARQGDLPLETVPLLEPLEEVIDRHLDAALSKDVTLELDVAPDLAGTINPEAFGHIIGNLVDNGIKYVEPGGKVRVRALREAGAVVVEVDDNGPGIDARHHSRIFERFYRVDAGRSRAVGGTGLGLAIVKHLCRATHAQISVRSVLGRGTTFRVELPPAA
ncbi:MAG: histidine kinase [Alphaproteobacteria bacterium]|nr:histidine kinase [Alphaproteobacteria bacterium]